MGKGETSRKLRVGCRRRKTVKHVPSLTSKQERMFKKSNRDSLVIREARVKTLKLVLKLYWQSE